MTLEGLNFCCLCKVQFQMYGALQPYRITCEAGCSGLSCFYCILLQHRCDTMIHEKGIEWMSASFRCFLCNNNAKVTDVSALVEPLYLLLNTKDGSNLTMLFDPDVMNCFSAWQSHEQDHCMVCLLKKVNFYLENYDEIKYSLYFFLLATLSNSRDSFYFRCQHEAKLHSHLHYPTGFMENYSINSSFNKHEDNNLYNIVLRKREPIQFHLDYFTKGMGPFEGPLFMAHLEKLNLPSASYTTIQEFLGAWDLHIETLHYIAATLDPKISNMPNLIDPEEDILLTSESSSIISPIGSDNIKEEQISISDLDDIEIPFETHIKKEETKKKILIMKKNPNPHLDLENPFLPNHYRAKVNKRLFTKLNGAAWPLFENDFRHLSYCEDDQKCDACLALLAFPKLLDRKHLQLHCDGCLCKTCSKRKTKIF